MRRDSWLKRNWFHIEPIVVFGLIVVILTVALWLTFKALLPLRMGGQL